MPAKKTLFEKVWEAHLVVEPTGRSPLVYIDLHLVHEVTSPQAFDGLRAAGRKVRQPQRTVATVDHNIPTEPRGTPITDPIAARQIQALQSNCKEFGVRLNFVPTVRPDGMIHMKVEPEVSALDFTNALQIQGFLIPALATNRVMSEMDLRDGQSFAVAGLIDNRVIEQFEKIPFIGDIPVLGKLFQSRNLNKSKNELLVVVTPRIVQPIAAGQTVPLPTFPQAFLPSKGAPPAEAQPQSK